VITVKSVYEDVVLDNVNESENGSLTLSMFNRLSKRAENRLFDYLTGDIEGVKPPTPYTVQKLKDILSTFIVKYPAQVAGGKLTRPNDYYTYDSMVMLGSFNATSDCDEEVDVVEGCNTPIEVLESSAFDARCQTNIIGLKPSFKKPIAKLVGDTFEFAPADIGNVVLSYVRFPKYAVIVSKMDTVYNEEVIDEPLSTNYEYSEFARELLIYFISDFFATHTREKALKEQNMATQKTVRG